MTTMNVEKFTPQAQASITSAEEHARKLDRRIAGAEDLLFGAVYYAPTEYEPKVAEVMRRVFRVRRINIDEAIKKISLRPLVQYAPDEQFTKGAKQALKIASKRAVKGGTATRFDLMVGLAQCDDVMLRRVLKDLEVDPMRLALVMSNSLAWVGFASKD